MPADHKVIKSCPLLDRTLMNSSFAFKWNVGWESGVITNLLLPNRKMHRNSIPNANFDVKLSSEKYPREFLLAEDQYTTLDTAPAGSWVCFKS